MRQAKGGQRDLGGLSFGSEVQCAHSAEVAWMRTCFTLQRLGLRTVIRDGFEEVIPDLGSQSRQGTWDMQWHQAIKHFHAFVDFK